MKILYLHHCGSTGGAGNSLLFILSKLKQMDHEIHVITQLGEMTHKFKKITPHVYEIKGVPVEFTAEGFGLFRTLFVNLKSKRLRKGIRQVCSIVNDIQPDLIHFNEIGMFSTAEALKGKFDIPIVMHARTVPNRKYKFFIRRFTKKTIAYVDQMMCITKSVANLYPGIENKRVIYNPLHLDQANVDSLSAINYHAQKLKVLFLANFYRQKGIQETLEAAIIMKDNTNVEFVIIGSNTKSEKYFNSLIGRTLDFLNVYPNYEKRLIEAQKKHQLKNLTLKGQVERIQDEIRQCHLLIAPMHLNGTPRSVFEAGMNGLPSILALHHQIDDLVEHGGNGFIIKEKSVTELVNNILLLEDDRALLESMGKSAREKYLKLCDQQEVANQVNQVYEDCLND